MTRSLIVKRFRLSTSSGRRIPATIRVCAAVLAFSWLAVPLCRAVPETLGPVTLTEVSPRIVTPNGDSLNDIIFFKFSDSLAGIPIETAVYDLSGARIAGLGMNSSSTALTWNGRDDAGRAMPGGVYIYFIKIGKSVATGTVVVAR